MMFFSLYQSKLTPVYANDSINLTNSSTNSSSSSLIIDYYKASEGSENGVNYLGILAFSLIFGNIIGYMGERGKDLHDFFEIISKTFLEMIRLVIW
jgi:Na+/H+-dicarboxylate symporter